jgi:cytochrome c biogenesis protein CcmG/thiol:disulfide interchange protein DsbE
MVALTDMRRAIIYAILLAVVLSLAPGPDASSSGPTLAPALGLTDLQGKRVDWKRFEGRVVLVDFWATWCQPCRRSLPELQELHERWSPRGFTVLGVSVDQQAAANVQKFVAARNLTYPSAIDAKQAVAQRYGVRMLPTAYLVDGEGRIVKYWVGLPDPDELEEQIAGLLPQGGD